MLISYQDFIKSEDKSEFIVNSISSFKASRAYRMAKTARMYFDGENSTILDRLQWFYDSSGGLQKDRFKANNQVPCEFFTKIVKQQNSYLLSNGVTLEDKIKDKLGRRFDIKLQKLGINALVDGVGWAYAYINKKGRFDIDIWSGTNFIPLFDERTSALMAGIRFWQTASNKPVFVELYEPDGVTEYVLDNEDLKSTKAKQAYKIKVKRDILGVLEVAEDIGQIPVVPLYANDAKRSTLTIALKNKIDLYDIIISDFGNNLEDSQDVYWVLKNYAGQDMGEFLADYKYYKSIKVDEDGDATAHTIEVPHEARKQALEILRERIYEDSMSLDTSILSGGSLTNIAIKANMANLDLKTDEYENQCIEFMENLIDVYGLFFEQFEDYEIKFIRRTLVNDTEKITNLLAMRSEISLRTFLEENPYIEDVDKELERLEEEQRERFSIESMQTTEEAL